MRGENFSLPFLYYTTRKFKKDIEEFILNFQEQLARPGRNQELFRLIKSLYINMHCLKNHLGECFVGMRNFKFSRFFKNTQTFYWHSFTSARLQSDAITKDLKGERGTLFHIFSMTGKQIDEFSINPGEGEVLFAPYTYFVVERVQEGEQMDEVWISEMTSPVTFQKNIILWVDDNPKNNTTQINRILLAQDI